MKYVAERCKLEERTRLELAKVLAKSERDHMALQAKRAKQAAKSGSKGALPSLATVTTPAGAVTSVTTPAAMRVDTDGDGVLSEAYVHGLLCTAHR